MNKNIKLIKNKAMPILRNNDVEFAGIFGSYARGEENKESDLDLLIRFARPKSLFDLVRLERVLSKHLGCRVDLVTEKALSPYIKKYVIDDLKVIYGKR